MSNVAEAMQKILNDASLKDSLALPALKTFIEKVETLERENKRLETDLKSSTLQVKDLKERVKISDTRQLESQTEVNDLNKQLSELVARERSCLITEIKNESLAEMIDFLKGENNMILRNAEIKKTIETIVPLVVRGMPGHVDQNGYELRMPTSDYVEKHTSVETTTETKE